jgi:DNA-binding transcriptional regulator YhcF (GntR family)
MNKDVIDRPTEERLLTRRELAQRWKVSIETVKRRERVRMLRPMRLDGRVIRYRMSDVIRIEQEGYGDRPDVGEQT